jgi:hypothetical protein
MGFFDLFKKKKRKKTSARKPKRKNRSLLKQDINNLKSQLTAINIILQRHQQDISENIAILKQQSKKIKTLEECVTNQPASHPVESFNQTDRPASTTGPVQSNGKFDINRFSNSEKKILSVFFNHKDMALSYRDIAKFLGRSPNTIKNQMHQIKIKAELFDKTVDDQSRNRFRLKDGLKIEKYLNVSH